MKHALALCCLALSSCGTTAAERKEIAIQSALDAAFLACQTALNDPATEWEPGAEQWCRRMLDGCRETGRP